MAEEGKIQELAEQSPLSLENLAKTSPTTAAPAIAKQALKERSARIRTLVVSEASRIGKKADFNDVMTLYGCWNEYVSLCLKYGVTPTYSGCLLACRLQHTTVNNWLNGTRRKNEPQYAEFAGRLVGYFNALNDLTGNEGDAPPIHNLAEANRYFAAKSDEAGTTSATDSDSHTDIDPDKIAEKYKSVLTEDFS